MPPNILFLMSDEHRPDVTGYEGNGVIRTPVMDELARTGVVFRNAYAPSPICIPGRQAMMTGQLPRTCGVERFGEDLAPGAMTFAKRLRQYAYRATCCGKLHHVGNDQMQGWGQRFAPDMFVDDRFLDGKDEAAFQRHGGPGRHARWKWSDLAEIHRTRADTDSRNQRFDRHATQAACAFVEDYFVDMTYDRATPTRPLLLKLSLLQPHYPYITPHEKLAYYFERVEPFVDEPVFDHPFLGSRAVDVGVDGATEREIRRTTAAYYGMIETIDEHYGQLMRQLEHLGQDLDDWLIIYTSDHGEMLGEHGVWEKQKFFEASARVPLIIRPPRAWREQHGCEGRTVHENVNLCDLFATLCAFGEASLPEAADTVNGAGLDSRSLVPLMRGETDQWHERYANETVSQFGATNLMIKRDALKYQRYDRADCREQPEVLFDLEADPRERRNVIDEPRYAEAVATFRRRCAELGFGPEADPAYRNAGYDKAAAEV